MPRVTKIISTNEDVLRITPMYTKADLTRMLQVSRRTITRMVARKDLPAPVMVGKRARWSPADIERFVDLNRAW